MEQRPFGRTGRTVGVVGFGAWQIGADWGDVPESQGTEALRAGLDAGMSLVDTADVYGDGRSERIVGEVVAAGAAAGSAPPLVATKMGRRAEQLPESYSAAAFRAWTDRSRANLGVDTLDLVQLHCPPTPVLSDDAVYDTLDALVDDGTIAAYGVSVETCAQALTAIARPRLTSVQVILNAFRQKPLDEVLPAARAAGVAVLARVPLASGLLSGRYDASTTFAPDDHRAYNRDGSAFDVGETFAGVPYDVGLAAVERLRPLVPDGVPMAAWALRWVIDQPGVTVVIPGARDAGQARANAAAADLDPLDADTVAQVRTVYDELVRPHVHDRW